MLPPGTRGVCFDAVGTLLHPEPPAAAAYAAVGRRWGSRLTPEVIAARFRAAFKAEEVADVGNGLRTSEVREVERWRRIVAAVLDDVTDRQPCFEELFAHFARPESWRCELDAGLVLRELAARGYALGMASNYDRRLRTVVAGFAELRPVQHLVISSEVGWRKPAGEFFTALVRAVGLPAGRVVLVGDDRGNDYEGARAAGLVAILYDPKDEAVATGLPRVTRLRELLGGRETASGLQRSG
jgi:putative hydrolase of the HAD superfamily